MPLAADFYLQIPDAVAATRLRDVVRATVTDRTLPVRRRPEVWRAVR